MRRPSIAFLVFWTAASTAVEARPDDSDAPTSPRVDHVVPSERQPHATAPAVIWYDDFDEDELQQKYAEKSGRTTNGVRLGDRGKSLEMVYAEGKRGSGGRKVFFGDSPAYSAKAARRGETFTEVYWRIYVKHQRGWTGGGPAKLSRATSLTSPRWQQAMIAHVWSSGEALTLDPASGVREGRVVTRKYNDFERLRWLGNKPASKFLIHSERESGRWVCVESRVKLNTPGEKDGLQELWIDGRLEAERRNLDWRGSYTEHGINAVFLEAYWNRGSPVEQRRWIDEFVISTEPIGPIVAPASPVVVRTPYEGPGEEKAWELQVAADSDGSDVVWRSQPITGSDRVRVDDSTGRFDGTLRDGTALRRDALYFLRVRQQADSGEWSDWSAWHQPFRTER